MRRERMTPERAEIMALQALGWLAGDDDALPRLLGATGIDGADLRSQAGDPALSVAILDFLLANEDLLLRFCEETSTDPAQIQAARMAFGL